MKLKYGLPLGLLLCLLVTLLSACRVGPAPLTQAVSVPVTATRDFGREVIFQREAIIEKRMTAQDVLAEVTEIQMDGSYIVEFEGLRGDDKVYWMYYINGLLSKVFASGYLIRPGDVMYWDYHPWVGSYHGSSAVIGSYPEPLLHGYDGQVRPTVVVYDSSFKDEADRILSLLKRLGVQELSAVEEGALSIYEKGHSNLILIAGTESPLIKELNDKHESLGMYAHFEDSNLVVTDYKFTTPEEYGPATGVIQACQNLWNPLGTGSCQNVVFMITGTDMTGVKAACQTLVKATEDILVGHSAEIDHAYGVIITGEGKIIKTPL
jgi:hypothetical protein